MRNSLRMLCIGTTGALSVSAQATGNRFFGNWENVDPATGGLTRLSITVTPSGLQGRAFGKCPPADCDWGLAARRRLNLPDRRRKRSSATFE